MVCFLRNHRQNRQNRHYFKAKSHFFVISENIEVLLKKSVYFVYTVHHLCYTSGDTPYIMAKSVRVLFGFAPIPPLFFHHIYIEICSVFVRFLVATSWETPIRTSFAILSIGYFAFCRTDYVIICFTSVKNRFSFDKITKIFYATSIAFSYNTTFCYFVNRGRVFDKIIISCSYQEFSTVSPLLICDFLFCQKMGLIS